jgi:hypothetical protein
VRNALLRIEAAADTGLYWPFDAKNHGKLRDRDWKKNREQLSGLAGMSNVYDSLQEAYGYVAWINYIHFPRVAYGKRAVKPDDRLGDAIISLKSAAHELETKLAELDSPSTNPPQISNHGTA